MKLNNLYDIITEGWKYTVAINIKEPESGRCFAMEFCRGLRKGEENQDFVRFMKSYDFNVKKIYGGERDAGIVIETEPVYIRRVEEG